MKWLDWWKQQELPETEHRPPVHQRALIAVTCQEREFCDHAWECQSQAWIGKVRDVSMWVYVDFCRACNAIRTRRIVQGTKEAVEYEETLAFYPCSTEQAWK